MPSTGRLAAANTSCMNSAISATSARPGSRSRLAGAYQTDRRRADETRAQRDLLAFEPELRHGAEGWLLWA